MSTAVACDLLTGLLDSWSLWDAVAGSREDGRRWRAAYLEVTYGAGGYRDYEALVAEAAVTAELPADLAGELLDRWDEVRPWPGVPEALDALRAAGHRLAIVTNTSEALAVRAVARVGVPVDVVVTAERAGAYKPQPAPYALALRELGTAPARTVFLAGSPYDVAGAGAMGMPVVWHNAAGLPARSGAEPVAEVRQAGAIPAAVAAAL